MACTMESPCGGQVRVVDQVGERVVYGCMNGHHFATGAMPSLEEDQETCRTHGLPRPCAACRAWWVGENRQGQAQDDDGVPRPRLAPNTTNEAVVAQIRRLRETGLSYAKIAKQVGVCMQTAMKWCRAA